MAIVLFYMEEFDGYEFSKKHSFFKEHYVKCFRDYCYYDGSGGFANPWLLVTAEEQAGTDKDCPTVRGFFVTMPMSTVKWAIYRSLFPSRSCKLKLSKEEDGKALEIFNDIIDIMGLKRLYLPFEKYKECNIKSIFYLRNNVGLHAYYWFAIKYSVKQYEGERVFDSEIHGVTFGNWCTPGPDKPQLRNMFSDIPYEYMFDAIQVMKKLKETDECTTEKREPYALHEIKGDWTPFEDELNVFCRSHPKCIRAYDNLYIPDDDYYLVVDLINFFEVQGYSPEVEDKRTLRDLIAPVPYEPYISRMHWYLLRKFNDSSTDWLVKELIEMGEIPPWLE